MSDDSSKKTVEATAKKRREMGIPGALFWSGLCYIAPQALLLLILPFIADWPISDNLGFSVLGVAYELLIIAAIWLVLKFYNLDFTAIGLGKKVKFGYLKTAILAFVVYLPISIIVSQIASIVFTIDLDQAQDVGFSDPQGIEIFTAFLVLVVLTPLAEELLFRGLMFFGLRRRLPFWVTSLIVSLLFAVVHWQLNVAIDVFVLSMISCYIREKSASLWPPVFLHGLKNSLAFLLLFVFKVAA